MLIVELVGRQEVSSPAIRDDMFSITVVSENDVSSARRASQKSKNAETVVTHRLR